MSVNFWFLYSTTSTSSIRAICIKKGALLPLSGLLPEKLWLTE